MRTRLAVLVLAAVGIAGCGAAEPDEPSGGSSPVTELTITVWPEGRGHGQPTTSTLRCDPDAGSEARACAVLAELGPSAFAPLQDDAICTQIYGGPQQARIVGEIDGEHIDARLSRENGCEISRWERVAALVPVPPWDPNA